MIDSSSVTFASLKLAEPLQRALSEKGYSSPSPIQARAIPVLLEGRDLIGIAQTGTGKTAAFALPLLHRLSLSGRPRVARQPRALVLTPTRELAVQIEDNFSLYGRHLPLRHALVFGGVGEAAQIRALAAGVDVLVATPGRLLDLMERNYVSLGRVEMFVLDEADRMLDMGFAPDVRRVLAALPAQRQSLLFSATMPEAIRSLAHSFLRNPARVEVAPVASTAERVVQRVCHVGAGQKGRVLVELLRTDASGLTLVFVRTKRGADRVARNLAADGIPAEAIHGNKSQNARQRALESFRAERIRVLVATDIAARGIDVKGISHVINFDVPAEPESYVHRIGRTARAGAAGMAISLCEPAERGNLRGIERLIRQQIQVMPTPVVATGPAPRQAPVQRARPSSEPAAAAGHAPGRRTQGHFSRKRSSRRGPGPGNPATPEAPQPAAKRGFWHVFRSRRGKVSDGGSLPR